MAAVATTTRSNTPLLLLLDGVLSQNEQSVGAALEQIAKIESNYYHYNRLPAADIERESPLRSALVLEEMVERLLSTQPHLARIASENDGSLPLHFAASIGNIRVATLLLHHHRDAALTHNAKGKIPLHYCAREGRLEIVRLLLRLVPSCSSVFTNKSKLALHFSCGEGHLQICRELLKVHPNGAILPSKKGKLAIHFAARWGHLQVAHDLYRMYPDCIQTLDYDGSNPLHDATREGQLEMSKFLVERCPSTMCKSNIRGEIPLFGAIRSGNIRLCAYLIRAWPASGKLVLQTIRNPDGVASWEPAILDICLRGAVGNFTDFSPLERQYYFIDHDVNNIYLDGEVSISVDPSAFYADHAIHQVKNAGNLHHSKPKEFGFVQPQDNNNSDHRCSYKNPNNSSSDSEFSLEVTKISKTAAANNHRHCEPSVLDITLPRSKSPILETGDCGKRRSASDGTNHNKKQRRGLEGKHEGDEFTSRIYYSKLEKHIFYQVHAALECSATVDVLKCVLERYPKQLTVADDYGRLPLHVAVSHCRSEGSVDLIIERIWKPYQDACFKRDYFGRLPLHLALIMQADSRLIRVLLDANPSSGVEQCQIIDERYADKLPIDMATSSGCDLSTVFMLVRGDPSMVQSWKCR